ncbi:methanogenic corrinoid protein MtbC1 [Humibacillus xanthopallidus]|uniref:Methanogenic corrinoid protein MtbC1 n=1 Tax=Humibacillus xanthopallidus TaxID=412689 RepID=A0A543PL01_9MICO|nr:B12-binding domain-containing protein [Humibacillus xanthopallidus]TQN44748.1 methanogenic corrinoid protein MtbC1 [Humibacillus xanthopallidus]
MSEPDTSAMVWVDQLETTLESFDEAGGHRILGQVFDQLDVEDGLAHVVMPYLHQVGQRWEQGKIGVAQEHFASNVLRVRLSMMLHGERGGSGPAAVLACMPGEQHEFGLMAMALVLSRLDWQVCYLGASTPTAEVALAARTLQPGAVVLSAHRRTAFAAHGPALRRLGRHTPVHIAGPGATQELASLCEAQLIIGDPVAGARALHDTYVPSGAPAREYLEDDAAG